MPHRKRMLKQIRSSARSCVVMGGVCCGLRERLEEERQERQEGQERPARPEILPTEEEAFEQLLAERKKPETMEEAMAQAVELTKLLQAMNGTTEEAQEGYEVGDLVVLSERVSQWRFNYAVVTEVSEARLTVMVLRDDRRTVVDVAWPSPCNVTLESRAGRLHQKVRVSQLSSGKHAGRRGQVALDARHKEFPLFVQRGADVELVVNVEFSASESVHFAVEDLVELREATRR